MVGRPFTHLLHCKRLWWRNSWTGKSSSWLAIISKNLAPKETRIRHCNYYIEKLRSWLNIHNRVKINEPIDSCINRLSPRVPRWQSFLLLISKCPNPKLCLAPMCWPETQRNHKELSVIPTKFVGISDNFWSCALCRFCCCAHQHFFLDSEFSRIATPSNFPNFFYCAIQKKSIKKNPWSAAKMVVSWLRQRRIARRVSQSQFWRALLGGHQAYLVPFLPRRASAFGRPKLVYRNYPSMHYCHLDSNEESSEGMWARSVKTLIERNIRHWANMPRFNDVLCWWERQALLSFSQISQTRMIKAQGNGHKRNMQQFKVKQCVDARGWKPFVILKNTCSPCVSLWAWCWGWKIVCQKARSQLHS